MIANLEDASGERGLRINPDDPWARHHLKSFDANNTNVSVVCNLFLTGVKINLD